MPYYIFSPGTRQPATIHADYATAEAEANRLAENNVGRQFMVCNVVAVVVAQEQPRPRPIIQVIPTCDMTVSEVMRAGVAPQSEQTGRPEPASQDEARTVFDMGRVAPDNVMRRPATTRMFESTAASVSAVIRDAATASNDVEF